MYPGGNWGFNKKEKRMSKFTPGPWEVNKMETEIYVFDNEGMEVCSLSYPFSTDQEANLKLTAKAPEMYDIIEDLRKVLITIHTPEWKVMIDKYLKDIKQLQEEINQ